jgi:hypothetical protein
MTTDAANLLAEIRRSGGDVTLVGRNRLKLVAPTALVPELAERVRAAKPMLLAVLADTGRIASGAQESGGGVLNPRRNSATAQHSTATSSSDRAVPTPAADWRARHRDALARWGALHPAEEAARLAWGELLSRWHMQHGERVPRWQCAGCREPIGGRAALDLADGNRVHLNELDCLLRFGKRWRSEAAAGLVAFGLVPPVGCDP